MLHNLAVGALMGWLGGLAANLIINWLDDRAAGKYRRQRLERAQSPDSRRRRTFLGERALTNLPDA